MKLWLLTPWLSCNSEKICKVFNLIYFFFLETLEVREQCADKSILALILSQIS